MQTSRETASSLSDQQAAVVMAAREQTGASVDARNSPSPGGITVNNHFFLLHMNDCVGTQIGNHNTMNTSGPLSHQHRPPQGDDDGSSSDSYFDAEDEDEDSRRRKMEQREQLETLKSTTAAASEERQLPYIRGVWLGTLFNSRTGQMVPPTEVPSSSSRKLKEPRTWKRWTAVRSGPDLYRALHVPYPLALKVLAGQAPEPDVPLVEWRQALSSPNCRALLLQAGTELWERTITESTYTPAVSPHLGMSHFVHRVVSGRQLFVLVILTSEVEHDIEHIDDILESLPDSQDDFDGAKSVFKTLDSKMKRSTTVQASFNVRPMPKNWKKEIRSSEEAVKLLSDFLSQPESVVEPFPKFDDDDYSSSDDDDASDIPMSVIKCFLRPYPVEASSKDPPAILPLEKRTKEAKQKFDRLYHNCLRTKELLDKQPDAQYRDYQIRELQKRRNAIAQLKGEFEEVIETLSVFKTSMRREEKELVNKSQEDLETDTQAFFEVLRYKLPPSTRPLNLLLLGKVGHGKSSTGNSILQLPGAFPTSGGTPGTTQQCEMRMAQIDGQVFKVVDTPGVFDPLDDENSLAKMCTAIALCPEGFHAVLIVWKYGTKMTPEEMYSIECLKKLFGGDLLIKYGVFLTTNGDQFEYSRKRGEHSYESFQEWQRNQMEHDTNFKFIVRECQGRCTLFDNATEDAVKQKKQLFELVCIFEKMRTLEGYSALSGTLFELSSKNLQKIGMMDDLRKKAKDLMKKTDVFLEATKRLSPLQKENLKEKERLIQGYRLTLQDTIRTENLDNTLADAHRLETAAEDRTIQAETLEPADDGSDIDTAEMQHDFEADTERMINDAGGIFTKRERFAFEAALHTARDSKENCFPGNATVRLQDGRQVKVTSLQPGDVVLCGRTDGRLIYSAVYMFGHKDEYSPFYGLALSTGSATLRVSHDHLIFRRHLESCAAVSARHVQVGDAIAVYRPGAATLQWEPVTYIQSRWETGVMAPFTLEGTVVVDDVLASCYVAVTSHTLCHALLWPMRKLATLAPRLSAHLHRPGEGGLPPWVRLCLHHLLPWLPRHRVLSA